MLHINKYVISEERKNNNNKKNFIYNTFFILKCQYLFFLKFFNGIYSQYLLETQLILCFVLQIFSKANKSNLKKYIEKNIYEKYVLDKVFKKTNL